MMQACSVIQAMLTGVLIASDAKGAVMRSADRYLEALKRTEER
ncbi:MAG: hypothetical protein ACYCOU_07245 [Sulfobacillus sp.]